MILELNVICVFGYKNNTNFFTEFVVVVMAEREQFHDSFDSDTMNVADIRSGFLLLVTLIYAQRTCLPHSFAHTQKNRSKFGMLSYLFSTNN